jgi:hypothetical protein
MMSGTLASQMQRLFRNWDASLFVRESANSSTREYSPVKREGLSLMGQLETVQKVSPVWSRMVYRPQRDVAGNFLHYLPFWADFSDFRSPSDVKNIITDSWWWGLIYLVIHGSLTQRSSRSFDHGYAILTPHSRATPSAIQPTWGNWPQAPRPWHIDRGWSMG